MLLRGFDERVYVFFINYDSRKVNELKNNNKASMTFFWNELSPQVRMKGRPHRLHDRVVYRKTKDNSWTANLLYP